MHSDDPTATLATIISDCRLHPTATTDTASPRWLGTTVASTFELQKIHVDAFKVFLRSSAPSVHEAFWIIAAALIRSMRDANSPEDCSRARTRVLQDHRLIDRAITTAVEGFPSGEIEPRRGAMLFASVLVEENFELVLSSYSKLIQYVQDVIIETKPDPVMLILAAHMLLVASYSHLEMRKSLTSETAITQKVWGLLVQSCTESYDVEVCSQLDGSLYFGLRNSFRLETIRFFKVIIESLMSQKMPVASLIPNNEPFIWILKNSCQTLEIIEATKVLGLLVMHQNTQITIMVSILPLLLQKLNLQSAPSVSKAWPILFNSGPSVLSCLSILLASPNDKVVQLTLILLQHITFVDEASMLNGNKVYENIVIDGSREFVGPDPRVCLYDLILPNLNHVLNTSRQLQVRLYVLKTLVNVSVHDQLAQKIAHNEQIMTALFSLFHMCRNHHRTVDGYSCTKKASQIHASAATLLDWPKSRNAPTINRKTSIKQANDLAKKEYCDAMVVLECLSCFRNLAIDEYACSTLFLKGSPFFQSILDSNLVNSTVHEVALSVLRNLVTQDDNELSRTMKSEDKTRILRKEFIEDVVAVLMTQRNVRSQKCALDIVDRMVRSENEEAKDTLVHSGCLEALSVVMASPGLGKHAQLAADSFRALQLWHQENIVGNDTWTRLRGTWETADRAERNRGAGAAARKKNRKKQKSRGKQKPAKNRINK
ncbi:hypothetical protein HDU84_002472 [Entophlyctis sp. JEL0112]|nr:hypothetical protein HDU84_002472 [Entophlyctis sp. JEL0112]